MMAFEDAHKLGGERCADKTRKHDQDRRPAGVRRPEPQRRKAGEKDQQRTAIHELRDPRPSAAAPRSGLRITMGVQRRPYPHSACPQAAFSLPSAIIEPQTEFCTTAFAKYGPNRNVCTSV